MRIKREVDEELDVGSPLEKRKEVLDEDGDVVPGGGRVAEGVAKEWVRRVEEALEGRRKREGAGSGAEGRPDEVEVWRVVVKNWTEGWVVEPFHRSWKSLSDDDEVGARERDSKFWGALRFADLFVADGVHVDEFETERFSGLYGAVAGKELHDLAGLSGSWLTTKIRGVQDVFWLFGLRQRSGGSFSFLCFGLICYICLFWSLGAGWVGRGG